VIDIQFQAIFDAMSIFNPTKNRLMAEFGVVLASDSTISGWSPSVGPVVVAMAPTSIVNTIFQDNHIQPALMKDYGIITSYDGAPVQYANDTFENNDSHYILFNKTYETNPLTEKQVFFGEPRMRVGLSGGDSISSSPLAEAEALFLGLDDGRLARIKRVCSNASVSWRSIRRSV
jgi:hypothetical protein